MARATGARPSALMGIDEAYEAWCVDEAITLFDANTRAGLKLKPPMGATDSNEALRDEIARAGWTAEDK